MIRLPKIVEFPEHLRRSMAFSDDTKTEVRFTFYDVVGDVDYYWDGTAWSESDLTDLQWNTEAVVAANITGLYSAMLVTKVRLRIRLSTDDAGYTPTVSGFRLAYDADIQSLTEQYLYRALGRSMRGEVQYTKDIAATASGGTTFNLATVISGAGGDFQVSGVSAV